MAQQWQLRRGTTTQHNSFTGAVGEVTVDTTTHALKVHDGVKQGGYMVDTVVAYQLPTDANDHTWYRKYASGWVEQGGWFKASATNTAKTITLPVQMSDANYNGFAIVECQNAGDSGNALSQRTCFIRTSATQITVSQTSSWPTQWEIKGMAA